MAMHLWSSARYTFPLPPGHRFPIGKYDLLRRRVVGEGLVAFQRLHDAPRASADDLRRVHTDDYVTRVSRGRLTMEELRRLGLPWSEPLVERSYRAVGGTCAAARAALDDGLAMNLAGGTHHAFADRGEGFCVFNDVAVAIRLLQHEGRIGRATIIDLDVHQGNGTHAIFAGDSSVFTFSMHGGRNYPFAKVAGCVDVELADGTRDEEYLAVLGDTLPTVLRAARPDLVIYLAGADPYVGDRLGRLALSLGGLARRDAMVLAACREVGIPVAIVIAGGYGREIEDTVRAHMNTVRVALEFG